jgi:probable rRNA maturation factor
MMEIEVLGADALGERAPPRHQLRRLCILAAASAGVEDGHLAIEFVDAERIAALNALHRAKPGPTDVLSFPIDGAGAGAGPARELGDVVICAEHTEDLREAILHGVLHLVEMDHEVDSGEMLAVQAELLRWEGLPASMAGVGVPGAVGPAGAAGPLGTALATTVASAAGTASAANAAGTASAEGLTGADQAHP